MKTVATFVILVFIAAETLAGPNRWTSAGPGVGALSRIYVSPADVNVAFASTAAGLYRTSDGGRTWQPVGDALPNRSPSAFTVAADGTAYAASLGAVYLSTDSGEHWSQRGSPGSPAITSLAFDPTSNRLIAGTPDIVGIYTSLDRGATWDAARLEGVGGVFKGIISVMLSATAAYATAVVNDSSAFFRSTDSGQTWNRINSTPTMGTLFAAISSNWLYGWTLDSKSFVVSKDEGKTWMQFPPPPLGANAVVPIGQSLFIGSFAGVFVYDNGSSAPTSISDTPVFDLAVSSTTPHHYYAAPHTGVMTFTDGDTAWNTNSAGLPGLSAADVDLSRVQPSTAYAATDGGVFRTDDGGQSWLAVSQTVGFPDFFLPEGSHIAVSPTAPNTAYVTGGSGNSTGVFRTVDAGATWQKVSPNFGMVLAIAPSDPQTLYAALSSGMSKSSNGGDGWSPITSNLVPDYLDLYYGFYASAIAIDPSSAPNVTIAKFSGIYRTTDDGAQWARLSAETSVRALTIDPGKPSTLYGAKNTTGFIRSNDGGRTWSTVALNDKSISTIALSGSMLFAGTQDGHIYRSDDGGDSWTGFDDGVLFGNVARVVVDSAGEHLYAATVTGVYSYDIVNQDVAPRRLDDDLRLLPHVLDAIFGSVVPKVAWLVPVTGTIRGASGTLFTTQLTLSNNRTSPQSVLISRVPRPGESNVASFAVTIPAATASGDGVLKFTDIAERLGMSGLGSLLITASDESGNLDPNGSMTVSTLIWSFLPGGVSPVSQTVPSAGTASFAAHAHARMSGLQDDSRFRANVGIVNLSTDAHQFTIQISGERASGQITIEVPALSLVQFALPAADYGQTTIDGFADTSDTRWLLYGSSINQSTGQAQTVLGSPLL